MPRLTGYCRSLAPESNFETRISVQCLLAFDDGAMEQAIARMHAHGVYAIGKW